MTDFFLPLSLYLIFVVIQSRQTDAEPLRRILKFCFESKKKIHHDPSKILNQKTGHQDIDLILIIMKESWFSGTFKLRILSEISKVIQSGIQQTLHKKNLMNCYNIRAVSLLFLLSLGERMIIFHEYEQNIMPNWETISPLLASFFLMITSSALKQKFPPFWFWEKNISEAGHQWLQLILNPSFIQDPTKRTGNDLLSLIDSDLPKYGQSSQKELQLKLNFWKSEINDLTEQKLKKWEDFFPVAEFLSFSLAFFIYLSSPIFSWYGQFVPSN